MSTDSEPPELPDASSAASQPDTPAAAWQPDDPAFEAGVLRAFIRGGRLTSIPVRERKRRVIYRYLLDQVLPEPDVEVEERELNMRLALWNPDVSTIRRGLIDLRIATRAGMTYRRAVPRRRVPPELPELPDSP